MFPQERQTRLDPVLESLKALPGFMAVQQDDFDSTSINVFVELDDCNSRAGSFGGKKPLRFAVPIRTMKNNIKKVLKKAGLRFNFLEWPVMQYVSVGNEIPLKDGYDGSYIKLEVFI
jgi:hypothetical protein